MTESRASLRGRYPVKRAVINESTAASNEIVAAVPGKQIVVVSFAIVPAAAVDITWQSAAVALSGAMSLAANALYSGSDPTGLMETSVGAALNILSGGAVQISGFLSYVEI